MDRNFILSEIKRTAEQNGGVALGRAKFETLTGIKQTDWYGKYWSRWGDALAEAGFAPNTLQAPYDESQLVQPLALLVRELGRFYDHRRRIVLPQHDIRLVELDYSMFAHDGRRKRLRRDRAADLVVIRAAIDALGCTFSAPFEAAESV